MTNPAPANRRKALHQMLVSMFSAPELRRFIAFGPWDYDLSAHIPAASSLPVLVWSVIDALERRNLIDRDFFSRVIEARPLRALEVEEVSRLWLPDTSGHFTVDVFLSFARADRDTATMIRGLLEAEGLIVWAAHTDIVAGEVWAARIHEALDSARSMVVLVSRASLQSQFVRDESSYGLRRRGLTVIPVLLEPVALPLGLHELQALMWAGPSTVPQLISAILRTRPSLPLLDAVDRRIEELARRFFRAAGRDVHDMMHEGADLRVPEAVQIMDIVDPDSTVLKAFSVQLEPGEVGYFVHRGDLSPDAELALSTLWLQGRSIVPLSERQLRAALQDNNARTVLHALTLQGRGGDDLFRTYNALIDRRFLFGRDPLLARIGSALRRGEQILLTGSRKSGKTSFLNILRQDFEDWPVTFVDLQRYDRMNDTWVRHLFSEIVAAYDRWGMDHFAGDWPNSGANHISDAVELERALLTRQRWHDERGPLKQMIVIFDEFERILPLPGETVAGKAYVRATGGLRALAQGAHRALSIIAADLVPAANRINQLDTAGTNPLFGFFQELPLPLLDQMAVADMVRGIGKMMGIRTVHPEFVEHLHALSGGHPFVARSLAGAASEARSDPGQLQLMDLEAGRRELDDDDHLGHFFRYNFWAQLSDPERAYLRRVAAGKPAPADKASRASLRHQGLVLHERVTIGAFGEWIQEEA